MSSSAGSDSGGGGNDMQVSGAEAFYSSEPGISTAIDRDWETKCIKQ